MRSRTERNVVATAAIACLVAFAGCRAKDAGESDRPLEASTRRRIAQGELVGVRGTYGDDAWLGVPFAEPPVGPLRWRAPQPPRAWTGEFQAVRQPPACAQLGSPLGGVVDVAPGSPAGQEDCLYLNVYAPPGAAGGEPLPVLFWIHGGGNSIGHLGFYDGGNLAATEQVIVVTAQYRLGPLGWFRNRALRRDASAAEQSGNFGTLDHIRALEWVRDNIAAFGGDPRRVTVFGESAGARNAIALLLSPPARGLFHGIIAQSGGADLFTAEEAENLTTGEPPGMATSSGEALLRLVIADGLAADRTAAQRYVDGLDDTRLAEYLRGQDAHKLFALYQSRPDEGMVRVANVFADGEVIAAGNALVNLALARGAPVPAIFGTNRDEMKIFLFADPRWVRRWFGIVPRVRDPDLYQVTAEALSRTWAVRGAVDPATSRYAAQQAPSFVYRWDWDEQPTVLGADLSQMLGAAHGLEIAFVFGHFKLGPEGRRIFDEASRPGRMKLSRAMMSYWAEFARRGDPGRGGDGALPEWRPWTPDPSQRRLLVLDTPAGGGIRMESEVPSRDAVLAALAVDPRAATAERRCRVYATMMEWTREITAERYRELGCAD